jgi:hypothetical protein
MIVNRTTPQDGVFLDPNGDAAASPASGGGASRPPDGAGPGDGMDLHGVRSTLTGAAIGAGAGSVVGLFFGNPLAGAWIGGVLGGYAGGNPLPAPWNTTE